MSDPAFRRFMEAVATPVDLSVDVIMRDHEHELLDLAGRLIETDAFARLDPHRASIAWGDRFCRAMRSPRRIERMAAELAIRVVHDQLATARRPACRPRPAVGDDEDAE